MKTPLAQAQISTAEFNNQIALLNQTPVRRNPRLMTDEKLFDFRIIDSNSQLVGNLSDLIVSPSGKIERIGSLIKTMVKEPRVIYKKYTPEQYREDISAFEVPIVISEQPSEREENSTAAALASLEPSSGGSSYSIKDMVGKDLTTPDGRFMGKIKNIVFNDKVTRIEALLLEDIPSARRNKEIAMPYIEGDITFIERFGNLEINLSYERADDLKEYARSFR
jgi:sporulation protein YlmC with PRC-barrel domain